MLPYVYIPNTWEVKARGLKKIKFILSYIAFKATMAYMRPRLKEGGAIYAVIFENFNLLHYKWIICFLRL